jgi:Xaa-Pro aminopeptidase
MKEKDEPGGLAGLRLPDQLQAMGERMDRVRSAMESAGLEALLLSLGADLPWLTGYGAMPLERLTLLVLPSDAEATLVVPELEAPRVREVPALYRLRPWSEHEDAFALGARLVGRRRSLAVSDRMWAGALLALQDRLPDASWRAASSVTGPLRAVKDAAEKASLRAASAAADRVARDLQEGRIPLVGRTEAEVSAELSRRLVEEGHDRVNFAIVASGPNSASPHHEPGDRVIGSKEMVVCDFGGSLSLGGGPGYCSDITRTVVTGEPSAEMAELYAVLVDAQARAVAAARSGVACQEVDHAAREPIAAAGYGPYFIHRTGHGIGLEEHEDPYLVAGNAAPLAPGHAFSVEPGIYLPGRFGARLEDIVLATADEPESLNHADHGLAVVG